MLFALAVAASAEVVRVHDAGMNLSLAFAGGTGSGTVQPLDGGTTKGKKGGAASTCLAMDITGELGGSSYNNGLPNFSDHRLP